MLFEKHQNYKILTLVMLIRILQDQPHLMMRSPITPVSLRISSPLVYFFLRMVETLNASNELESLKVQKSGS